MKQILKAILFLLIILPTISYSIEPAIVGNAEIKEIEIDKYELINIFTRKQLFWNNGQRIVVFIKPLNSIEHKIFITDVLNLTPFTFKQKLDEILYAGKNSPAQEIPSDEMMLIKIESTPYSIGYVNYSLVLNSQDAVYKIKIKN